MEETTADPIAFPEIVENSEEEEEEATEESALVDIDDTFYITDVQIPKGPFMPQSAPDLQGLSETQIRKVLEGLSDQEFQDLVNKNTESFRCLAQALISRSSLMRHILYHFPPLEDPGIDEAFNYVEQETAIDDIGAGKYRQLCKDMNIAPISRVIRSLSTDTLNLKYYGLSDKQFKAILSCVMLNTHIKTLILDDNWISPEAALWLCEMLRENNSIRVLNLRECRLGTEGLANCAEGFSLNQSVREIDLSYNDLGDEGIEMLVGALKDNYNVDKLNLSHNNLGESSGLLLGELLKEHTNIDYLDLSWNNLYEGKALGALCKGISESDGLECLNLAWNGIGTPETLGPVAKYVKGSQKLQFLDLSFNRMGGPLVGILTGALKNNISLKGINLGFNLITPNDAIKLTAFLTREHQLEYMDLKNVYVNKNFVPILKHLTEMGKKVRIEGVLDDYTIEGPDPKKVIFDRCRYLAEKPKKKALRKDFGSDFIWSLPDEIVDNAGLKKWIKKSKIKLDNDLIDFLGETFSRKKKKIELKFMRDSYLELYPDTQPPTKPEKSKKDKKGKKGKKGKKERFTEDKGTGTDLIQMSSLQNASSLVTSKMPSSSRALVRLSIITKELLADPNEESEKVMSTVNLEDKDSEEQLRIIKSFASVLLHSQSNFAISESRPQLKSGLKKSTVNFQDEEPEMVTKVTKAKTKSIAFRDTVDSLP